MADETTMNGVASHADDRTFEIAVEEDRDGNDSKISALMQKIAAVEQEKRDLVHENQVITERIKKFKDEIESLENDKAEMKSEIERSEADKKALQAISARAAGLETEVSRLQHDLISSLTEAQDANAEASELKRLAEELKKSESEKGSTLEVLEKERNLLLERVNKDAEGTRESKAETESRIRELEKKIEALEVVESNHKRERVKVEEEMRGKLEEREEQIRHLKKVVDEFQSVIARNRAEMERSNKEREGLEIVKNELEALLKKSERKAKEMEHKLEQLHKNLEGSEKMISGLKEKAAEAIVMDRGIVEDEEKGLMGLKMEWPLVAASAGVIAAVAIVYLRFIRQR